MVVDDSPSQREWLSGILAGKGYEVAVAATGTEALRQWDGERPDLVLLNTMLPDIDGLQLLRHLKESRGEEDPSFVPVILLSAKADLDSSVNGLSGGADDFLAKPFAEAEALARVGAMLRIKALQDQLRSAKQSLEKLSIEDGLTRLFNHRFFDEQLRREFHRAVRHADPLSLLMIDLDHFKRVNDQHGHPFGDQVLRDAAQRVRQNVRDSDVCARYGGEEFAVILPRTPLHGALRVATRIVEAFRARPFVDEAPAGALEVRAVAVTTSIGVACFPAPQIADPRGLVKAADGALYRAKRTRDTIAIAHGVAYTFDARAQ
jgi:two-component system, cell cycle response regulator